MSKYFRKLGVLFFVLSVIFLTMSLIGLSMGANANVASNSSNNDDMVAHYNEVMDEIESLVPGSTPRLRTREEVHRQDMIFGSVLSVVSASCGLLLFKLGSKTK